jgi:hypothetical protein
MIIEDHGWSLLECYSSGEIEEASELAYSRSDRVLDVNVVLEVDLFAVFSFRSVMVVKPPYRRDVSTLLQTRDAMGSVWLCGQSLCREGRAALYT